MCSRRPIASTPGLAPCQSQPSREKENLNVAHTTGTACEGDYRDAPQPSHLGFRIRQASLAHPDQLRLARRSSEVFLNIQRSSYSILQRNYTCASNSSCSSFLDAYTTGHSTYYHDFTFRADTFILRSRFVRRLHLALNPSRARSLMAFPLFLRRGVR